MHLPPKGVYTIIKGLKLTGKIQPYREIVRRRAQIHRIQGTTPPKSTVIEPATIAKIAEARRLPHRLCYIDDMDKTILPIFTTLLLLYPCQMAANNHSLHSGFRADNARIYRNPETLDIVSIGRVRIALSPKPRSPELAGIRFLKEWGSLFGYNQEIHTLKQRSHFEHRDQHLIHYEYLVAGLPVFLEQMTVQVDEENQIRRITAPRFASPALPVDHPLTAESSLQAFAQLHGYDKYTSISAGWIRNAADDLIAVVLIEAPETDEMLPHSLYISAKTGRILRTEPLAWTNSPTGLILEENPTTTPTPTRVIIPFLDEDTDHLSGKYARVATCLDKKSCKETTPLAKRSDNPDGNFGYRPIYGEQVFEDPFAEVNAYYHVSRINFGMRKLYGWNARFKGETWIEVKVGRAWYNAAFYQATKDRAPFLVFGQDIIDFAYDTDVVFHEFGHGINRTIWQHPWMKKDNLGMDVAMFSLEEAAADVWAQHLSDDPVMDNYVTASRTALNTLTCPDSYLSEGHMEARFLSALAWDVRETIGPVAFGHVFYRTLHFLSNTASFEEFAIALADSTEDLRLENFPGLRAEHKQLILDLAGQRGIGEEDCTKRIVPMWEGETRSLIGYGSRQTGKHHYPAGLQWRLTIPDDKAMFALFLTWRYPTVEEVADVEPGYKVYLRRGNPVEVTWLDEEELEDEHDAFSAIADAEIKDSPALIEFPPKNEEPLRPGEEIYVLVASATKEPKFALDAVYYLYDNNNALPPQQELDGGVSAFQENPFSASGGQCHGFHTGNTEKSNQNRGRPVFIRLMKTLL